MIARWLSVFAVAGLLAAAGAAADGAADPVAGLYARIATDQVKLTHDGGPRGYLTSLLAALNIDPASQVLVFSKTSLQMERIGPWSPRALYFNDELSVGFIPGAPLLEFAAFHRDAGVVFYTMNAAADEPISVERHTRECASCHSREPFAQMVVESVYPQEGGVPFIALGTIEPIKVNPATPFEERWGGWYVTGTHGRMKHRGNSMPPNPFRPLDLEGPQNVMTLKEAGQGRIDTAAYPGTGSDIVALMVLEHQMNVMNLMSRLNRVVRRGPSLPGETAEKSADELVQALFFAGEAPLEDPIAGSSAFAANFTARGPRDGKGRTLREFDLKQRLFRYRLSYMVYSQIYQELPEQARQLLAVRISEVLAGDGGAAYQHLQAEERTAIREILTATAPYVLKP